MEKYDIAKELDPQNPEYFSHAGFTNKYLAEADYECRGIEYYKHSQVQTFNQ